MIEPLRAWHFRAVAFWLLVISGAAALIAATLTAPEEPEWGLLAVCLLVATLAATYRPVGGSQIGLGGLVLIPMATQSGAGLAAILALVASLAAKLIRGRLTIRGDDPPPERRGPVRALSAGVRIGCATLLAGLVLNSRVEPASTPGGPLMVVVAICFVATLAGSDILERVLRAQPEHSLPRVPWGPSVPGALWDGFGLLCGFVLLHIAGASGWPSTLLVFAMIGALATVAARLQIRSAELSRRVHDLEGVGSLALTVISGGRRQSDLVEEILEELRDTVQFSFVQLDIVDGSGQLQSWWATEQGPIQQGEAEPGDRPPRPTGEPGRGRPWVRLDRDLGAGDRKLGRFRLWCDPRRQTKPDFEVLEQLVPQLASLVERSTLDREARLDSLTGLSRREVFNRALEKRFDLCRERGASLAVVLCDIDHFKRVNDTYGHAAGDRALGAVSTILAQTHRDSDLCCRYGGEEFALLMPDTQAVDALHSAERIRAAVEDSPIEIDGGRLSLTLSAGVAAFPELYVATCQELVSLADRALYAAKRQGRNRCLQATSGETFLTPAGVQVGSQSTKRAMPQL